MVRWTVTGSCFSNIFPFNIPPENCYRGGMHKCIPYAKIIVLRFVESWWWMNRAERINPFPTKHLDKYQFVNMLTKADKLIQNKP